MMIGPIRKWPKNGKSERHGERGVTLAEILIIVGILGVILLVAVPLTSSTLRRSAAQTTVNEFEMSLRASRVLAVTRQTPMSVTVQADPVNRYSYTDRRGQVRQIDLPASVTITSSDSPITFERNGSVSGGATTVIDVALPGGVAFTYTVSTSAIGIVETTKVQN